MEDARHRHRHRHHAGTDEGHNRTIKGSDRVSDWHPALFTTPDNERMRQQIVGINHSAKSARVDLFVV
jgi:hypothetical protein